MPIEFDCPTCRTRIKTPDAAAGKKARCPSCQAIVAIPAGSGFAPIEGIAPLGATSAPLPSAASTFPGTSQPTSITSAVAKANPTSPAPWLPPADAFAPRGTGTPDYTRPNANPGYGPPPLPVSQNPFGELPATGGALNPYASSTYLPPVQPLTREEVRARLLGPAIGMALGSLLCLALVAFFVLAVVISPDFQNDMQNRGNQPEIIFACIFLAGMAGIGALPYFAALFGAYAMYRGRGLITAWVGAIAGVLPCSILFIIPGGFAIWGMVVLNDPAVHAAMSAKD